MNNTAVEQNRSRPIPPLRTVREAQGLGLRETARLAGIDPGQLSRIERGQAPLPVATLARLAPVLGLTQLAQVLRPFALLERSKACNDRP